MLHNQPILPGQTLGILGGGQLGSFFSISAKQLGYRVSVWDPNPDAPAAAWADTFVNAAFDDEKARQIFSENCQAATYEWENIPVALVAALESEQFIHPGSRILALLQNRISEKDFLSRNKFPVTPYEVIQVPESLQAAAEKLGFPVICKTATAGYDGHGQWRLENPDAVNRLMQTLAPRSTGWVLEKVIPFQTELSIVAARYSNGKVITYPVTENIHEGGILRECRIPAAITPVLSERASFLAREILSALDGVGVFCMELFLLEKDRLLVNEIAPRPHNSGHYSLDVCSVSQYAQQVRSLCNLPCQESRLLSPAIMVNILGSEIKALQSSQYTRQLLEIPGAQLYHYGKKKITPRRKMGHVTVVSGNPNQALEHAAEVRKILDDAAKAFPKKEA